MLVPEALDGDSVGCYFHLEELVHVDVVNVELLVRNSDRWERALITKDRQFLAVSVEGDVFDLSNRFSVLYFELSGYSELLISASGHIKHLDHLF